MRRRSPWALVALGGAAVAAVVLLLLGDGPEEASDAGPEAAGHASADPAGPTLVGIDPTGRPARVEAGGWRVTGRVVDASRRPVAGVLVEARRTGAASWDPGDPRAWGQANEARVRRSMQSVASPPTAPAPAAASVRSGPDGAFEVALEEGGSYDVQASPDPPLAGSTVGATLTTASRHVDVLLRVQEGTPLRGRVVDAEDRPLEAVVTAYASRDDDVRWSAGPTSTRPGDGGFEMPAMVAGKWAFSVALPGRMTLGGWTVALPHPDLLVLRVGAGGGVRGRVSDARGSPVAGAEVLVSVFGEPPPGGETPTARGWARTAADGTYRMDGLPAGRVTSAQAAAEGYVPRTESPPLAAWTGAQVSPGSDAVVDLVLESGVTVEGTVRDAAKGTPIEGVDVFLSSTASMSGQGTLYARTDADGRYAVQGVPPGKAVILPRSGSHYHPALERMPPNVPYTADGGGGLAPPPDLVVVVTEGAGRLVRDLVLTAGLPVRGRVLGPAGEPVEGAEVRARDEVHQRLGWQWGMNWVASPSALATSDRDGSFLVRGLPPREQWTLSARKGSLTGATAEPVRLAADAPPPEVVLRLAEGASVSGRVVDESGEGVLDAQIWFWSQLSDGTDQRQARTGLDGAFAFEGVASGPWQLHVNARGYAAGGPEEARGPGREPLRPGERRTGVEVRVRQGVRVTGTLVDEAGKPVPGKSISLTPEPGGGQQTYAVTRPDGTFEFTGAPRGRVRAEYGETDGGAWSTQSLGAAFESPAEGVRLVLKTTAERVVEVRVVDPSGAPVPLCRVRVSAASRARSVRGFMGGGDTSEVVSGRYRQVVRGDPPFEVRVSGPRDDRGRPLNLLPATVRLTEVPTEPVEVRLEAGDETSGRVVGPGGEGVAGAYVQGGSVGVLTEESGGFRLPGIPPGDLSLDVTPPTGFVKPPSVRTQSGAKDVEVVLVRGLPIAGTVLDPDGQPVANASVSWAPADGGTAGRGGGAVVQAGRFRIEGVPPDGPVTLTVHVWALAGGSPAAPTSVPDVAPGTTDLVVRLERGVTVEGVVVDADGRPFRDGNLIVLAEGGAPAGGGWFQPQADGTFRMTGLKAGPATVRFQRSDGGPRPADVRIVAPTSGVRIQLPRTGTIRGRVEGEGPLSAFRVEVFAAGDLVNRVTIAPVQADGEFSIHVAETGSYDLSVRREGDDRYATASSVQPGAGEVVLTLRTGLSIEGVVEGHDGNAVANTWVEARGSGVSALARTDADGRFRFRGLPPGTYALLVRTAGRPGDVTEVPAGATSVRLRPSR